MNNHRISAMNAQPAWKRVLPGLVVFMATLAASPGHAIEIPGLPLQSGAAYPPANIMFILDDSGSMEFVAMPRDISSMSNLDDDITDKSYVHNTIYYNPAVTYQPWLKADGTRYSGGTSYTNAYSHASLASGGINLSNSTQTYFVPKVGITDQDDPDQYVRYRIGTDSKIYKRESSSTTLLSETGLARKTNNNPAWIYFDITNVPAGASSLVISMTGGSGDADLYVRRGNNQPTTNNYDCRPWVNGNNETCSFNNPSGRYRIGINAYTNFANVSLTVTLDSLTEIEATPGRTPEAERTNFATWYSYHRTRMKVAKAGASDAFSRLGENVRVGYDSIWNRSLTDTDSNVGTTPALPIPVDSDGGLFQGTNRTDWYTLLHAANGNSGTPLRSALQRTGNYYQSTASTGPWGPGTGANQISCRQNFAILTSDGYWNSDSGFSIGDQDGTPGPTVLAEPDDRVNDDYTYVVEKPYHDNFDQSTKSKANTLADVAMAFWKNDLRPTLENNVPTSIANPAFWQHMVTFAVSIGLQGRLNPKADLPLIKLGSKHWGDPMNAEDADRVDDLWHAAVNSRGTFVAASNPLEFSKGLLDALETVAEREGSASNVSSNSTSLALDTRVYQASYFSGKWTGELEAFDATAEGVSATPAWRASEQIPAVRKIFTWTGTAGDTFPTAAQLSLLDQSSRALSPATGAENAAYIKGDQTKEKTGTYKLRDRGTNVLGDIVNSSPIYVKDNETIFVGANDGMLHAFSAIDVGGIAGGTERFAYVPGGIDMAALGTLSDPQYVHKYFVDGPIIVSTQKQTPGFNYLVGSLGRGGKGMYGLDVTNPGTFSASDVKWELTSGANMGYVLGEPMIVTLNDADNTKAVVFGNGINSTSGSAVLYVVNIATGAVIQEIDTLATGDNGLSAPRGWDNNGDGTVDYIYAGDLEGNLWKFDFTGPSGEVALGGLPMFQTGTGQPISAGLALARDPTTGKRWVFIGTGSFMTNADLLNTDIQSMYGVIDDSTATITRADLLEREIVVLSADKKLRGFEPAGALPSGKKGWYIDLDNPTAGERIVSRPQIRGTVLITASIIPPTQNTCEAGGSGYINAIDAFTGTSTGAPYFDSNNDGVVDEKDVIDHGDDEVPVGSVDVGVGMPTLPNVIDELLVVGGSDGSLGSVTVNPQGGAARRVSWREILRD